MLRNLRLALGSNSDRLQIVVAAEQPYLSGADLDGAYVIDPADIRAAEEGKAVDADYISGLGQGFYLVDPAGNLMMRYFVDSEGAGILQDLKRLLRYSRIG
jgi:hypothetical protein